MSQRRRKEADTDRKTRKSKTERVQKSETERAQNQRQHQKESEGSNRIEGRINQGGRDKKGAEIRVIETRKAQKSGW